MLRCDRRVIFYVCIDSLKFFRFYATDFVKCLHSSGVRELKIRSLITAGHGRFLLRFSSVERLPNTSRLTPPHRHPPLIRLIESEYTRGGSTPEPRALDLKPGYKLHSALR